MLKISKLADYAHAIMHFMATHPVNVLSATEIADALHISAPTVSKVLKMLSEAKLLTSLRGSQGGYQLSRSAKDISLIEIITAMDGMPALTECNQQNSTCRQDKTCLLKHNWRLVNRVLVQLLENLTLADMSESLTQHPLIGPILEYKKS